MTATFSTMYLAIGLPVSAFIAVVTLISMFATTYSLRRRYKNANWAPVSATVEESGVARQVMAAAVIFTPVIKYRYTFGKKQYLSSAISPDLHYAGSRNKSNAQKWVVLFPVGTSVTAYLDQKNPGTAVLFPDFRYGWWYVLLSTFAVFGACNFLLFIIFAAVA